MYIALLVWCFFSLIQTFVGMAVPKVTIYKRYVVQVCSAVQRVQTMDAHVGV